MEILNVKSVSCIFLLQIVFTSSLMQCPDYSDERNCTTPFYCPNCLLVDCIPELSPEHCPEGTVFEENVVFGACCPACVKYLSEGDLCDSFEFEENVLNFTYTLPCTERRVTGEFYEESNGFMVPVVEVPDCNPNTHSCDSTSTCNLLDSINCLLDLNNYDVWLKEQLDPDCSESCGCEYYLWKPECDNSGVYDNVQSKVNNFHPINREFCSDPMGNRLFGTASWNDGDITCKCSRKRWELEQDIQINGETIISGREDITLHCQENGNYEPLQCDDGRCWCADEATGSPKSGIVHENLKTLLPCFDSETFGSQYLRRCESRAYGKAESRKILAAHGLIWNEPDEGACGYDGSFGLVNCDLSQCRCVDKYKETIGTYYVAASYRSVMNCQCARDNVMGYSSLSCITGTGNYKELQTFSDLEYCVDEDGFQVTAAYPNKSPEVCEIPTCTEREDFCRELNADGSYPCILCKDEHQCTGL